LARISGAAGISQSAGTQCARQVKSGRSRWSALLSRCNIELWVLPSNFDGLMERKNGKFLNTSATNYYLAEMIKGAADRLILISPFLKSRSVISMKAAALSRVLTCMNLAR
jgi:hypothetical protein